MSRKRTHHVARIHPIAKDTHVTIKSQVTHTTAGVCTMQKKEQPKKKSKSIRYNSLRFRWLKLKMSIRLFWYNNCYRAVCMFALGYMLFVGRVKIVGVKGFKAAQGKYIKGFVFTRVPATEDPRRYLGFPF